MKEKMQISSLVNMNSPAAIIEEVKRNFIEHYNISDFELIRRTFNDFNDLFDGNYPGYRACNTKFHDKTHTTDALIAISRLIDGYNIRCSKFSAREAQIAHLATILHDSGYIQIKSDKTGTGAKYTLFHVERSIAFMENYFKRIRLGRKDFISARNMVHCTGVTTKISDIKFSGKHEKTLGLMLGTSDLLGQMSSRIYLEKLMYLYQEFKEGNVPGYDSELELLKNTIKFYDETKVKLKTEFESVYNYARDHFKKRYKISKNLYETTIESHIGYLKRALKMHPDDLRNLLRRHKSLNSD